MTNLLIGRTGMKFAVSLLLVTAPVFAQDAQGGTLRGVVLKGKAPVSNEVIKVRFPKPVEAHLKNGVSIMLLEDHKLPAVSIELSIPVSPFQDPPELRGVAEATADLMKLGTKTRSSREIAEALDELGATMNVATAYGSRYTRLTLSGLTDNLDALLDLFADILLNPSFPQDEFDKYRQRELSALQQARTQPQFLANERVHQILYPSDARAITSSSAESLRKLTRDDLVKFYADHFHSGGVTLGVTGDVKLKTLLPKLEARLGGWKPGDRKSADLPVREPLSSRKIVLINRPNSVQSYIVVANRSLTRPDPAYINFTVMNRVLGEGPASRLFRNIREDKGFTYGIYSNIAATRYLQHFSLATSVRTEVTGPALEEIFKELKEIRETPIPASEFAAAKRAIVARFALDLERPSTVLSQALLLREYGLPADYWDTYPDKVMGITTAQATEIARKYVPYDNAQIVVVGDAPKIRDVLAKFGTVEEVEAN